MTSLIISILLLFCISVCFISGNWLLENRKDSDVVDLTFMSMVFIVFVSLFVIIGVKTFIL